MFINCPHCQSLVATDPATELPPPRCPRCAAELHEPEVPPSVASEDAEALQAPAAAAPQAGALAESIAAATAAAMPAADDAPDAMAETTALPASPPPVTSSPPEEAPLADPDGDPSHPHEPAADIATAPIGDPGAENQEDAGNVGATGGTSTAGKREDISVQTAVESGREPSGPTAPPLPRPGEAAPDFARMRAPAAAARGQRHWLLPSLIAGLSLLLALQWMLADRARLAADARWRPFVAQLCGALRCTLPPWREPAAFTLLARDVRPRPGMPGVLHVSATFRNDARWAQPWPVVVLSLSDLEGRTVGARAFAPGEYLGAAPTRKTLASGQSATIRMDVVEPAPRVVAFAFDFR